MNYAKESQRYYELAEREEFAANMRKQTVAGEQLAVLQARRQWNPLLKNNTHMEKYLEARIAVALEADREYQSHLGMQRHYLRKANAAANQAFLHGHTLAQFEEEGSE